MTKPDIVTAKNGTKCSLCNADISGMSCKYDKENNRFICDQHQIWDQ